MRFCFPLLIASLCSGLPAQLLLQSAYDQGSSTSHPIHTVAHAGDVDADGHVDWLTGSADRATLYSGKDGHVIRTHLPIRPGTSANMSVAGGPDFNGDGFDDYIVGSEQDDRASTQTYPGSCRVFSGKDGSPLAVFHGYFGRDSFGSSVAVVGDVDGDKVPDIAVGAPRAPADQGYGYVMVLSVKKQQILHFWPGLMKGDRLGLTVQPAGDVDGDGVPDVLMTGDQSRAVQVRSGKTGKILFVENWAGSVHTYSSGGGHDVDLDGRPDFFISKGTLLQLYSGKKGTVHATFNSAQVQPSNPWFCILPDLDRDGTADVAVRQATQVSLYSVKSSRLLGKIPAPIGSTSFGSSLVAMPDMNGDGIGELLIGDRKARRTYVYSVDMAGLSVSQGAVSVATGGKQDLFVRTDSSHAQKLYLILGSMTGTSPGIVLGKHNLPLVADAYFGLTASAPNTWISNSLGILDSEGRGTGSITMPPKTHLAFKGRTLYHAALAINLFPFSIDWTSNATTLKLNP